MQNKILLIRVLFPRSKKLVGILMLGLVLFAAVTTILTPPHPVSAATSSTLNFQARLQTATGAIVPDGTYNLEFKLYNSATVTGTPDQGACTYNTGTTDPACQWTETRINGNKVQVKNGYLTVNLGSVTSLPNIDYSQQLWLTMRVGGTAASPTWDPEMNPRLQLTAVPYAFQAGNAANANALGGIAASGFIQNTVTTQASSNFNISGNGVLGGSLTVNGNVNLIKPTTNSTTAFQIQPASSATPVLNIDTSNGRVGINTASPTDAFTIVTPDNTVGLDHQNTAGTIELATLVGNNTTACSTNVSTCVQIGSVTNTALQIGTNGTVRATVAAAGNFGIATDNPGYKLDVAGDINTSTQYRIGGTVICTATGCTPTAGSASYIQNQTASPQASSGFNIDGSGTAGTSFLTPYIDTASSGALNIGTSTSTLINIGRNGQTVNFPGLITGNGSILLSGTFTTASNYRLNISGTLNSSSTTSQYSFQNQVSFTPNGASLTNLYGLVNSPSLAGSSLNITTYAGQVTGITTTSGYTGQISNGYGILVSGPTIAGSQLITDYRGISINTNTDNGGNTTGTINNTQLRFNGNSTAAAAGGTLNNYGAYIIQSSGSGAGTTNNYGLYITGNGAGTANYAIYNNSTAANYLQGNLSIGTAGNAGGYALNTVGDVNTSTQYRIGGTVICTATGCTPTGSILQTPTTTAANTITPTAASVVGLTVNATSGTSAAGAIVNQGQTADTFQVNTTNTTGTQINGVLYNRNGAGGTTTNAINVTNTAGTLTNGLSFTGTIGTDINRSSGVLVINGAGGVTLNGSKVQIGSATSDATQVNLQLDSFSTLADTGTCSTTVNQGALYYNANVGSNAIRACINGAWEDVVSTSGLGIIAFGVVPDSGTAPGDLVSITAVGAGPCKVIIGGTTATLSWTACTAYSGGRKVIVAAGTTTTTNAAAGNFQHLCLNGTNNQPTLTTSAAENAGYPTFSAGSPVLCIADIAFSAANNTITRIYDTRIFTTTTKQFANIITTAPANGKVVKATATNGQYTLALTSDTTTPLVGVVAVSGNTTTANSINAIIATAGQVYVKAGSAAINQILFNSTTTAGYADSSSGGSTSLYANLGIAQSGASSSCSANTDNCRGSIFTVLNIR